MSLAAGTKLGPYDILAPLGAGGMGEVYRARDTRLGRDVAVKALPDAFARDPQRVARFQREAQILASVSHPHIAGIYGLEEVDHDKYLVLEFIDGESLAARVARGRVPVAEALPVARQILDALEAAHDKGIVHRDLKPSNIMLTREGEVKVLDFGLAKVVEPDGASATAVNSPTMTALATQAGVLLGTAAYMSPEQAKGRPADKRSDIWAFGCVLYEMLTGRRAFAGDDVSDTLAAILRGEPDWTALPADTPRRIQRLLKHCLRKDRKLRMRDMGDVLVELNDDETDQPLPVAAPASRASRTRERAWMAAAAVFALAAIGAGAWTSLQPKPTPEQVRFTIAAPENAPYATEAGPMALSPDGRRLAFVATVDGKARLWVRDLDSLTPRLLPGTEGARHPMWSPNSRFVLFVGDARGLHKADVNGGTPITIADTSGFLPSAWSHEGVILFTAGPADGRLYRIPDSGGQPVAVTELDKSRQETLHTWPIFLPGGRRFIYAALSSDASKNALWLASLDSSARKYLLNEFSFVAYAQSYLFFQRRGTLMAQPFDEKAGRVTGDAVPMIEGVESDPVWGDCACSVSADGTLVYLTGSEGNALTWFDAHGQRAGTLGERPALDGFRISPDGDSLAVSQRDNSGNDDNSASYDIWTIDLERNVSTRLTSDPKIDNNPIWSADGTNVIFRSDRKGTGNLYQRAVGGGGADELLFESPENKLPTDASRDGKLLLFTRNMGAQKKQDIWALPLTGDPKPFPVVSTDFNEGDARFSPDSRQIAYQSDESGTGQIYIQPFPPTGPRVRVSTTTGKSPAWSTDGKQLFYQTGDHHVMAVDVTSPMRPGVPKKLFTQGGQFTRDQWTMDPVHERFLMVVATTGAPITVVMHWTAGLGKK